MPQEREQTTVTDLLAQPYEERLKLLARLLLQLSYREGDFTLTSGKKSDYYFDCKQTALNPKGGLLIASLFLDKLAQLPAPVQAVAGMTLGADPLVSAASVLSALPSSPLLEPIPAIIIRKKAKGHGTGQYLEGMSNVPKGARVAMLEDVVTTGGTLVTAIHRVQAAGYEIGTVLCVLDRQEGGSEALAAEGFPLTSIYTRQELKDHGSA